MSVELHFQGPGALEDTLLSELILASQGATAGGGIFAWSNAHGAHALLSNPTFLQFATKAPFSLIIGTDTITDPRAIEALQERAEALPLLTVQAFVHSEAPLFHPKMAWFKNSAGLRLLVGSGNFTRGGLQANWEIFTSSQLTGEAATKIRQQITDWQASHASFLLELDDPRVAEQVEGNVGNERSLRKKQPKPTGDGDPEVTGLAAGMVCLVAEVPKNRKLDTGESAFSQANFPKAIFEDFFEVRGSANDILLYHVNDSSALDGVESTNGKYKPASRNYYFEMAAAAGLPHSGDQPPIAVFLKLDSGAFLYLFRLPGQTGYEQLSDLLAANWVPKSNQLRRFITDRQQVAAFWPGCPILTAKEPGS